MAQLLNEWCIPCEVLPGSDVQRTAFRLTAWCSDLGDIPPVMDLAIPEPEATARERHCLLYPISISVMPLGDLAAPDDSPAPPPPPTEDDSHRRRRRHRPSASSPPPMDRDITAPARAHRAPVHSRLGPQSGGCQGASQDDAPCDVQLLKASSVPEEACDTVHEEALLATEATPIVNTVAAGFFYPTDRTEPPAPGSG